MDLDTEMQIAQASLLHVLGRNKVLRNETLGRYLSALADHLGGVSDRTDLPYYIIPLDSKEANSFSLPGGFIFITRGLLRCCGNEGALAAVLAHEIAHVQFRHGLRSIRSKRLTEVGTLLLGEATAQAGSENFGKLTTAFGGSIDDVADTLIQSKYSRETEVVADKTAVIILERAGYDPSDFVAVLEAMKARAESRDRGLLQSHPEPDARVRVVQESATARRPPPLPATVRERFAAALKDA